MNNKYVIIIFNTSIVLKRNVPVYSILLYDIILSYHILSNKLYI